jgi:hypothetical protein
MGGPAGTECNVGDDCAEGLACVANYGELNASDVCAKSCASPTDCTDGTTCSATSYAGTARACLPPCTHGSIFQQLVCEAGTLNRCDEAQTPDCLFCGCPSPDAPVCDNTAGTCGPLRELGEDCSLDTHCISGRCGDTGCEIPSGGSCVGQEQYCGGTCGYGCLYTCSQGCDFNSKCFGQFGIEYCAVRCTTAGDSCASSHFGGAWTCKGLNNGNAEDYGPWCVDSSY